MQLGPRQLAALIVTPVLLVTACGSSSSSGSASATSPKPTGSSSRASGPTSTSPDGVKVSGAFGTKPSVTIPAKAAPTALGQFVITPGTGATVGKGDLLVANYVGETWAPKNGKPNVFDSSFTRGAPAGFPIGVGGVVPGWDKILVGKKLGSRVLLTLPPADGYGAAGNAQAGITGTDTLVFVVDLVKAYSPNASAPGTAITTAPAGYPKVTNVAAKAPTIDSVAGVEADAKPRSVLLVKGSGEKINPAKTLVLQLVETDLATGKATQSSWGKAPQAVGGQNVLGVASALTGQNVGSRAVIVVPGAPAPTPTAGQQPQAARPAQVLVVDVVGQF